MPKPCGVSTCPCLADDDQRFCWAHKTGWKATVRAPQPCPICSKVVRAGHWVTFNANDLIVHSACLRGQNK